MRGISQSIGNDCIYNPLAHISDFMLFRFHIIPQRKRVCVREKELNCWDYNPILLRKSFSGFFDVLMQNTALIHNTTILCPHLTDKLG